METTPSHKRNEVCLSLIGFVIFSSVLSFSECSKVASWCLKLLSQSHSGKQVRPVPLFSTRAFHYNLHKITLCSSTLARDFSIAQVTLNERLHKHT
ncbi:hypothetical protein P8452_37872 [Trifolium repens]|nr:hypothetical protein P8452_37872 [Trifolium repens]